MAVHTYIDMSTSHVSAGTMLLLEHGIKPVGWPAMTIAPYEYGVFVTVPPRPDDDEGEEAWLDLPSDLAAVLLFARAQDAYVVRLDADGDQVDGLDVFDW